MAFHGNGSLFNTGWEQTPSLVSENRDWRPEGRLQVDCTGVLLLSELFFVSADLKQPRHQTGMLTLWQLSLSDRFSEDWVSLCCTGQQIVKETTPAHKHPPGLWLQVVLASWKKLKWEKNRQERKVISEPFMFRRNCGARLGAAELLL